jgi:hypothetical protein
MQRRVLRRCAQRAPCAAAPLRAARRSRRAALTLAGARPGPALAARQRLPPTRTVGSLARRLEAQADVLHVAHASLAGLALLASIEPAVCATHSAPGFRVGGRGNARACTASDASPAAARRRCVRAAAAATHPTCTPSCFWYARSVCAAQTHTQQRCLGRAQAAFHGAQPRRDSVPASAAPAGARAAHATQRTWSPMATEADGKRAIFARGGHGHNAPRGSGLENQRG